MTVATGPTDPTGPTAPPTGPAIGDGDSPVWEPHGHPVRRAAAAIVAIAALAVASIWFGALSPRVDVRASGWSTEVGDDGRAYVELEVHNDAHAAVRLRAAGESLPGLELVATERASGERLGHGDSVELGPGETATVTLRYRLTDCDRVPDDPPAIPVTLRTPLGVDRTVDGPDGLSYETVDGVTRRWTEDLLPRCHDTAA